MAVLQGGKRRGDLDDVVLGASIDLRVNLADVVEDVEHEGAAAGAHLVDEQVVVRVRGQAVVGDEVARNGLAVVRAEELRGRVPQLARRVLAFAVVELVLEFGVPLAQDALELDLVSHRGEVEGLAGAEDDGLLGEIAVVGVV